MRPYNTPASPRYKALQDYLSLYLTPASMKTYWAFICAFEPYIKNAINPIVVKSAAKKSGFDAEEIDVHRIMSYNPEFARLSVEKADEVIGLIKTVLEPFFTANQWIPESLYPEIFPVSSGYDFTLTTRIGTHLNDLVTNRQRFMVDNSEQWQALLSSRRATLEAAEEEKERKRLAKEIADAAKPVKVRSCSQVDCQSTIDVTTPVLKKANEKTWKKCKAKNCATCPNHIQLIATHETFCVKCNISTA